MNLLPLSWLELSLAVPLVGAAYVGFIRSALTAYRWSLGFVGVTFVCTIVVCAQHFTGRPQAITLWNRQVFAVDDLNAPLLPLVALLHALIMVATARTELGQFSFPGLLSGAAVRLGVFAGVGQWPLVALLAFEALLPFIEIRRRGRPGRLYIIHAGLFIALLVAGWACAGGAVEAGSALLLAAVLVRTGVFPAQVWMTDAFENGLFGSALLLATPLAGVYAALRLVFPVAPEWTLEAIRGVALFSAVYAAGMSIVQQDGRRFFAYQFVSHASLVLVGLGLHTPFAVTGALVMWMSMALSLTGLGLAMRAVEARVGSLSLTEYRGLYEQSPALAVGFLLTGLAAVGFPGTSGFVAIELLVDEAVGAHVAVGVVVVLTTALNGIAVVRAYLLLFTGRRYVTGVALGITPRERIAGLTLASLILGGGLVPQLYLESRHRVAEAVLDDRRQRLNAPEDARNRP